MLAVVIPVQIGGSIDKVPLSWHIVVTSPDASLKPGKQEYVYWSPSFRDKFAGIGIVFVPNGGLPQSTPKWIIYVYYKLNIAYTISHF